MTIDRHKGELLKDTSDLTTSYGSSLGSLSAANCNLIWIKHVTCALSVPHFLKSGLET
jgi:hypothetical protein